MLAYGLDLTGLSVPDGLFGERRLRWHEVAVVRTTGPAPERTHWQVEPARAVLAAASYATIEVNRSAATPPGLRLTVTSPTAVSDEELTHPLLAFGASAIAGWLGRSAFHGGAVLLGDGVWVFLAGPGGGKSTLVSELSGRGHPVLADDLSVVDGGTVLAGPRSCDLRQEAAARLARGGRLAVDVGRPRFRTDLGPAPAEARLAGFVALGWGSKLGLRPLELPEKLGLLAAHDALQQGPARPESFLRLLPVPMWELTRPQDWAVLPDVLDLVETRLGGARLPG